MKEATPVFLLSLLLWASNKSNSPENNNAIGRLDMKGWNETEKNTKWDRGEGYEKNYQYDYDDLFGGVVKPSEYYFDIGNGVIDAAEFCVVGEDGECDSQDPFEDRNCNEKWDDAETADIGNGIWDDDYRRDRVIAWYGMMIIDRTVQQHGME